MRKQSTYEIESLFSLVFPFWQLSYHEIFRLRIVPKTRIKKSRNCSLISRSVASGGRGGRAAPPVFDRSVNPISTRGTRYAHHVATCPPGFSDLATALISSGKVFAIIKLI